MGISKLYRRKFRSVLFTWILLANIFITSLSYIVPLTGAESWWDYGWNFRKSIKLNHTMVTNNLENFPVLIDIIDNNLRDKAQFDGDDIVFIEKNGSKLTHEIELYDGDSGHLVAWVKIPLLSSAEDTELYMYYGNPDATNQQNSSAVWDSNFVMIQHLNEPHEMRYDSTDNHNDGTAHGGVSKGERIGKADLFEGVNGYVEIPGSLLPTSAITVELWLKPLSYSAMIWRKHINTGPTTTSGICGGQTSLSQERWSLTLTWDGKTKIFSTGGQPSDYNWIHLAVTWNGSYCQAYHNGMIIREGTISGTSDWAGKPLYLGSNYYGGECFEGSIDEVRTSNISRSPLWIQTSYRNQKDPSAFCTIEEWEEVSPEAETPLIYPENPSNGATDVYTNPTLCVRIIDPYGQNMTNMTIIFKEKVFNTWQEIGVFNNAQDGTYTVVPANMDKLGTTYYWSVSITTNGTNWTNKTYSFTTTTKILEQKWVASTVPKGVSGVLIADVNNDGIKEVIHAGKGGVVVLNGIDGSLMWNVPDSNIGDFAQPQMADLNHDGILEIIVPLESPAGLLALHANNGSTCWRTTGLGKETFSSPVICDIDGSGYPTIFTASTDISNGLNGTGRVTAISYNGSILHQAFSWRPCSDGLSIADTDGDGEFELYMGDRYMYLDNPEYGDNDYGKGVQSFWAKNLTLRWSHPDIFCSSNIPMLADVNNDGILDVIVGDMNGGAAILNSTDGSVIRKTQGIPDTAPVHYQPSVYDIDNDGNLELLMADPHDWTSDDIVVWDLVKWQVDAKIYIGKCFYGPQVADVTGDGIMEIVACNYKGVFIFDRTYRVIDGISGLSGILNYAVVQDIDGDGYNELVVSSQSGYIYAFNTPARTPTPAPRTEVQFYSEYRRGAAEYVPPLTCQEPIIFSTNPQSHATDIQISLSELEFTLTDYQHDLMNYTITTDPYIGSNSNINVINGKFTLHVSNLTPSTTYTWTVKVTDGTHWTNKTFIFTTGPFFPWWNANWYHRKPIIIDHNMVTADLENFPILIDIVDNDLPDKAQPNGSDIAFTDSNGIKLNHEIELYDNTTGHLIAWVNAPLLSSNIDTRLYMYYNSTAPNQQNSSAVWDSNFVMVQHLEENSGARNDSTTNSNNGTVYGEVNKDANGKIGLADAFNGSSYVKFPENFLPANAITVELWLKPSSFSNATWIKHINTGPTTTSGICGGQTSLSQERWSLTLTWDNKAKTFGTGGQPSGYDWVHLAVTWNDSYCYAYYNGVKIREGAVDGTPDWLDKPLFLGSNYHGGERFNGSMDEVRVSNIARSAAWVQISYVNQKHPSTFYTMRKEESIPEAPMVFDLSPPNKASSIPLSLSELSFNLTDCQGDSMNYTVTTNPNIGSWNDTNVTSGRFTLNLTGTLEYSTTYTWTVNATDGNETTTITFSFTTLRSDPPYYKDDPTLEINGIGDIICYNQTTYDPDGDKVTNVYNWYRNNAPITNLLLPFDTNSSTTTKDYSGYNNNGKIVRRVTWASNGRVGGAYNFERGFIQIPGTNTLDGDGTWSEITVEHWINLAASQSGTRTIAKIPSYEIGVSGNKIFAGVWIDTGNPMLSGYSRVTHETSLDTNTWYHVALTYKSGEYLVLYVNGVAVATTQVSGSIQTSGSNPLYIGWFDYFQGMIDEVRIYPESLSPQQIYQRYFETKDGLTNSSTIVSQETETGEVWKCKVTPNDADQDGTAKFSNPITLGFKDDFNDNSTDFEIWKTLEKNNGTVSETNNRLECTVPSGPGTAGYITKESYDLSDSYIQIDVSNQYLCEAALAITLDGINDHFWYSDNFYVMEKHRWSENCTVKKRINGGEKLFLYNESWTGPTGTLRIRIENGIIYFYEEGNLRYSEPFELASYKCYIHFEANTWDTNYNGTDYFDNFIFLNNKPTAYDLTITPTTPRTTDDLVANYTYFDPDGDPENATEVRWYKNSELQPHLNDTVTVPAIQTAKGETWYFTVKPCDGKESGETQTSQNVTIQNTPPIITSHYPDYNPTINETQSQEFNITCSDIDGDSLNITWFIYYENGTLKDESTGESYTFYATSVSAGTYTIIVKVSDGEHETSHQWTLTVEQHP